MSRVFRFALVGLAMAGVASVANAQACVGMPSFSVGSARVGGNMLIGDNAKSYGAEAALGSHNGLFVVGNYSHAKDDNSDGSSNAGGATLGYEYTVNAENQVQFCPMVGVNVQTGSLVGLTPMPNHPQNTLDWHVGGSLGWTASESSSMSVIPAIGAAFVGRSYKAKIVTQGAANPSTTDSFGLVTASIGFVFNKRCTIAPMVQVPVSELNGKTAYGVAVSYNFNLPKALHM
ncbi:MAG TPA: hypothetical protein VMV51_10000 [Gemmatimonadaceae bacterium]|nr:hypothetical protein [Gemmatimonadaceae bacterium]